MAGSVILTRLVGVGVTGTVPEWSDPREGGDGWGSGGGRSNSTFLKVSVGALI